uniref:Pepsin-I3 domain-containing protein n=1 Tax=Ascaris lumbricoides TaxID=6252 RepID=A0A0M3IBP4_ASCLU
MLKSAFGGSLITKLIAVYIQNGGIYVNGQLKRMMTSDDVAALNDYNKKVRAWKYGVRDTILARQANANAHQKMISWISIYVYPSPSKGLAFGSDA